MSTTKIRSDTPTCGAASPTPGAAYIVSIMSSIRRSISGVMASTAWARLVERGVAVFENRSNHVSDATTINAEPAETAEISSTLEIH